ncbi:MAG: MarR family transcriptional regulator [Chthoniobacter sp.]|uniref:MarR family winged helix-turn-helix transcriptional regulator n=1 Tax=Chthoniobacter sp. TaxID=2510640 RepID=UPI0032ACD01B
MASSAVRSIPPSPTAHPARRATALDDLPLYLPRVYYAFLGVVERKLEETHLSRYLQPGMGHVLLRLYEGDNCIIKDISHSTHIAHATLTGLLKRMEKGDLVSCRRCPEDGRAVRVQLTPLGRSLEPRIRDFHRQIIAIVEQGMSPGEVHTARDLLNRMLHSLRAAEEAMRPAARKSSRTVAPARRKPNPRK